MAVKILQLNVDRTRRVVSEVRDLEIKTRVDILAIHESYVLEGKIASFGVSTMMVYGGGEDTTNVGAALVLLNPGLGVMKIEGLSDKTCVVAEIVQKGTGALHSSPLRCCITVGSIFLYARFLAVASCLIPYW